jgi:NADH:ubiquinone oxidoreductase subunit 4 (subunit M)
MTPLFLLSLIVFLPALSAIVLMLPFWPKNNPEPVRWFTLLTTIAVFILTMIMVVPGGGMDFDATVGTMQHSFSSSWIPSFSIQYYMGLDGISFPLVVLTALVSMLAMGASWSITKNVRGYCILFLLLEMGMLGVFMSLDFFLFYVFWELMLLPMYFLIGIWGGPRKEYAALKFFIYTLVGGVMMLIAILMLYFTSDIRGLAEVDLGPNGPALVSWEDIHLSEGTQEDLGAQGLLLFRANTEFADPLEVAYEGNENNKQTLATYDAATGVVTVTLAGGEATTADVEAAITQNPLVSAVVLAKALDPELTVAATAENVDLQAPVHTFNMLALAVIGQHTEQFSKELLFGWTLQHWAFLLLFIGFIIKVPSVPFHTWLPDAHVEAPTPISMILAGVLLKMGGYGIIRICYPICPDAGYDFAYFVCMVGVVSMVYGAFAALAQNDFKRMVAYSSVSHMGYVVLGLGVWSATAGTGFDMTSWNMGVKGAMFQMIGHGISSAGMFFCVGVIYDRVHHRNLNEFGGLYGKMPVYTALAIGLFFAGLGLPGLCGFIGEVFVVMSVFKYSVLMGVIAASVVILTAGYILWAIQRVYLGAEYKGPHEDKLTPITLRELCVAVPLFVLALVFGIFPHQTVLKYMDPTIDRQINELTEWTRRVKEPKIQAKLAAEAALKESAAEHVKVPAADAHPAGEDQAVVLPQVDTSKQVAAFVP